jgi:hypothetical protein
MNCGSLKLPTCGVKSARYINGMREIISCGVHNCEYIGIWHTFINNEKFRYSDNSRPGESEDDFTLRGRTSAFDFFRGIEVKHEVNHG